MASSKRIAGGKTAKAFVGVKMNSSVTIEDMIDPAKDQMFYDNKDLDALMHKKNTNDDVFDNDV